MPNSLGNPNGVTQLFKPCRCHPFGAQFLERFTAAPCDSCLARGAHFAEVSIFEVGHWVVTSHFVHVFFSVAIHLSCQGAAEIGVHDGHMSQGQRGETLRTNMFDPGTMSQALSVYFHGETANCSTKPVVVYGLSLLALLSSSSSLLFLLYYHYHSFTHGPLQWF